MQETCSMANLLSRIDSTTDAIVQKAIREEMQDATILCIARELAYLRLGRAQAKT